MSGKLTQTERLILANQSRILSFLDKEREKKHELNAEILEENYHELFATYVFEQIKTSEITGTFKEVEDILDMFRAIRIYAKSQAIEKFPDFKGFDQNDVSGNHYFLFQFLKVNVGRYRDFDLINSHSSLTIDAYKEMLNTYNIILETKGNIYSPLTQDEFIRISEKSFLLAL